MTSSEQNGEPPPERGMSRRFAWLAFAILAAIGLYTAGWYHAAGRLEGAVAKSIADARQGGASADCTGAEARGYPFRIGLFCDGIAYSDGRSGVAVAGKGLRSAAQVYQPSRVVGELDTLSLDIRPAGIEVDLADIRYSARLAAPVPELASIEGRSVVAGVVGGNRLATADTVQAHMRSRQADLDLAGSIVALRLDPATGVAAPPLDGEWDMTLADGIARLGAGTESLRGVSGEIRTLLVRSGTASLALSGPVSVGADGLVDADLSLSVTDPASVLAIVRTAFPDMAGQLGQAEVLLTALGETPTLPLSVSKGVVRITFFTLGRIPPLD